jgi:ElaB/YqjD/DUF883 family membrane-anchored ribosome-binding protein
MASATKRKNHSGRDLAVDWQHIKGALADAADDIKGLAGDWVDESVDELKDQSEKIQKNISEYAEQKPLKALAIAALIGFVVGYWWRR